MNREIRQTITIAAAPEVVSATLTSPAHLSQWWTREVSADGDQLRLDWSAHGWIVELELERIEAATAVEPTHVVWRCLSSNMLDTDAWEGTRMHFDLVPTADGTRVDFVHSGYRDSPCFSLCEQGWAFFLGVSLKRYVETGEGFPYPDMPDPRAHETGPPP